MAPVADALRALGVEIVSRCGATSFCDCVDVPFMDASDEDPPAHHRAGLSLDSVFGYICERPAHSRCAAGGLIRRLPRADTSGTTGLPKAAVIKHTKLFSLGAFMTRMYALRPSDRIYTCLPLYHTAGGGLGIGCMLYGGCTVVLRRKFSASSFFQDCAHYKCTVVQYIGELCRYLLATPPSLADKAHRVRIAIGNGLRPEIWSKFQSRFGIKQIGEFYGATEGNGALANHCVDTASVGAVGRMGTLMKRVSGMKIARFDVVEEEVFRDADGWCVECDLDEPGELLIPIKPNNPFSKFEG